MTEKATEIRRIPCLVYSRVVGYLRPVQHWHDAKKQEFDDRREFVVDELVEDEQEIPDDA